MTELFSHSSKDVAGADEVDGNILDIKFVSIAARDRKHERNDIQNRIAQVPLNLIGEKRDGMVLYPRSSKPINYPVKDLFPKDREEESGSGSGNCKFYEESGASQILLFLYLSVCLLVNN